MDPLGDALEAGQVRVVRRGLAADLEAVVEAARVPVEAEVPVQLLDEEVELLRLRHLDFRMQAEVVVDAGRAALEAADDDQVRQLRVAFAAAPEAALAVGRVALAGARAHRLVGGVAGRPGGAGVRVGLRHERASLAAMPLADLGSSFNFFFNSAAEFFRHLSEIHWTPFGDRPALPAGDAAGPCLGLAQRAARRLPGPAHPLPAARRRLPGRGRDQRGHPGPRRRRDQGLPGQTPDPRLLLPGGDLLLPGPDGLRHQRSASSSSSTRSPRGCCRRCRRSPTCPPSRSPSGPTTRRRCAITVGVAAAGDRDRDLLPRPPRAALLGPGPPGRGDPQPSRAATCARSPPGRGSAGSAASPPSGSSSRPSASAARSAT